MSRLLYAWLYRYRRSNPVRLVTAGYLGYIAVGWALLCMPWSQRQAAHPLDHLFTATSAVSTTGLSTLTVPETYTFFGQLVILALIQLGGIGYMTFGSFVVLSTRRQLQERQKHVLQTVFSIPSDFRIEKFVVSVIRFTLLIEIVGVAALYPVFVRAGAPDPLWQAVFHSVSAFCTAGFSLFSTSFEMYRGDVALNLIITALSLLGAVGFIVCVDVWRMLRGRVRSTTLTTRIILVVTGGLLAAGTLLVYWPEPFAARYGAGQGLLCALFQAMSALTTVGFNTVPIGELSQPALVVLLVLMVIGASPSGTGGGLKTTTFSAIVGVIRSACRGDREVRFWGAAIPDERVRTAVASFAFYVAALTAGTYLLTLTESMGYLQLVFENASALGTVGLSMGITSSLSSLGKVIVILMMYIGRVGPLTFGMALFVRPELIFDDDKSDLAV